MASNRGYLFWSHYTAAQAHNTGRTRRKLDRRVRRFFKHVCTEVDPTLSIELGAHEAAFSSWAKVTFPDARCLAFEANPYVHEKHAERLATEGVDYQQAAVAATNGTVTLNIPTRIGDRHLELDRYVASLAIQAEDADHKAVDVPAVRLDDFLTVAPQDRVVAWIDVEGASDQVLPGGSEVLARAAAVYIEVEDTCRWQGQWLDVDVARYFEDLGKVPVMRDIQRTGQYNVVFVDQELAGREEISQRAAAVLLPPR